MRIVGRVRDGVSAPGGGARPGAYVYIHVPLSYEAKEDEWTREVSAYAGREGYAVLGVYVDRSMKVASLFALQQRVRSYGEADAIFCRTPNDLDALPSLRMASTALLSREFSGVRFYFLYGRVELRYGLKAT